MVSIAGSQQRRYKRLRRMKRQIVLVCVAFVVLAGAAVVTHRYVASKKHGDVSLGHQVQLSLSARQALDVSLVAGAVGQYSAANAALPTHLSAVATGSLVLCGATCDPSSYAVGGFSVYQPSNIHLMSYAPALTVPNQDTMYLVAGAKCTKDGKLGDINLTPRSMVILYATATTSGTTPRCIVL